MKKLMTSVIILLPLIILLIMLVSGAIIGFITHIYVESVEFAYNDTLVLLLKDESQPPRQQLAVNVFPLEADNRSLRFTVEDDSVAQVSNDGTLTAKYFGETYVRVTSTENAAATASLKVIVTDTAVHALAFDSVNNDMYVGETQRFAVRVIPQEAVTGVEFTSDNVAVLSVNKITGDAVCHGAGTATITATSTENPAVSTQITVTCHEPLVSAAVSVSSVVTAQLTAQFPALTVYPANATYNVTYSVSDDSVASVDGNGNITFAKAGFVTVTATAADGRGHSASAAVNYRCTYGYYLGNLFEKTDYTFDYDQYKGKTLSDIVLRANPDGAYRQIIDVSFSGSAGLISFNSANNTFTLNNVGDEQPLGVVQIVIHARKYDTATEQLKEFTTDVCTVTVTRNTQSVSFVGADGNALSAVNVRSRSVNIGELLSPDARPRYLGVVATPFNHTDKLSYALADTSVATLDGTILTFNGTEGTANLTVGVKDGDNFTVSAQVAVTYLAPVNSDVQVNVDTEHVEQSVALEIHDNGTKQSALLDMNTPEGYVAEYDVTEGKDVVTVQDNDGVVRFVPQKGGFATITIKLVPAGSAHSGSGALGYPRRAATEVLTEYTVEIYVDREVPVDAISFDVADGFRTAGKQVNYTITLNVDPADGIMEGKELFVNDSKVQLTANAQSYTYTGTYNIENLHGTITAQVRYGDKALELLQAVNPNEQIDVVRAERGISVSSSDGKLDTVPTVNYNGSALQPNGTITFANIGDKVTLTVVQSSFAPADISLETVLGQITFSSNTSFEYTSAINGDRTGIDIVLTSRSDTDHETVQLNIAGQSLTLEIVSPKLAEVLSVKCGAVSLDSTTHYYTLLGSLTFTLSGSRNDGMSITDKHVKYRVNDGEWQQLQLGDGNSVSVTVTVDDKISTITFAVAQNETVAFTVNLRQSNITALDCDYTLSYKPINGNAYTSEPFKMSGQTETYLFPCEMADYFMVKVTLPQVDGVPLGDYKSDDIKDKFVQAFSFGNSLPAGWSADYNVNDATSVIITVNLPSDEAALGFTDQIVTLTCGERSVNFNLSRIDVASIGFVGYDSSSYEDNHKGYQQVRVFAKHSSYDGTTVDYILIPLKALVNTATGTPSKNLSALTFTFTAYNSKADTNKVLVTQRGTTVTAGNEVYTIVQNSDGTYRLDKNGSPVVQDGKYVDTAALDIPWIDVYSQGAEGYARLYFGNFTGLSESDVQNDYFGNFFERSDWSAVEDNIDNYDGSGRTFAASEGAYSYLRVEADDGVEDVDTGVNTHFNFNVLQDNALVNVFNATGYYANSNIVLHENLYGPGELSGDADKESEATDKDLILTRTNENGDKPWNSSDSSVLGKTIIYGNGYQVNFEAKNAQMMAHGGTGTAWGVYLQKAINTDVKASNTKDTITKANQCVVLVMQYGYYSTIENYSKISPWGSDPGRIYLKNTVLRYCSQSALQLYYSTSTAYIENVVVNESVGGFTSDNKDSEYHVVYNFKGFVDELNYMSYLQLGNSIGTGAFLMDMYGFTPYMQACDPYLEWFGQTPDKLIPAPKYDAAAWWGTRFANVFLYSRSVPSHNSTVTLNFWNESTGKYDATGELANGIKVTAPIDAEMQSLHYNIFVYDNTVDSDGGLKTDSEDYNGRNMSELFSNDRYIRLLCQYTSYTGKGYNAKPVKNVSHIQWHTQEVYRNTDWIEGREQDHMTHLKNSLEGVKWPDGSGVINGEAVEDVAATANALASHTILPERKEEYC